MAELTDQQALVTGMVVGALLRQGIKATPAVDKEGNYLNKVVVLMGGEALVISVDTKEVSDEGITQEAGAQER